MSSDTRLDYPRLGTHVGQQVGWRKRVMTFSHALILPDGPDYRYLWKTEIHAAVSRYFHVEALRPAQGLRSWGVSRGVEVKIGRTKFAAGQPWRLHLCA